MIKNNILFFIILILFLNINLINAQGITEQQCIQNIVSKYQFPIPIVNGSYNICGYNDITCDSNGLVDNLLNFENINKSNKLFLASDVSCFNGFQKLYLNGFYIDSSVLKTVYTKCNQINLMDVTFNFNTLNFTISPYSSLYIKTVSFELSQINLDYFQNVIGFTLLGSNITLLSPTLPNTKTNTIYIGQVKNIPDFTLFQGLTQISFEVSDQLPFDITGFQYYSTIKATVLIMFKSSTTPIPISVLQTPPKTNILILYYNIEVPTSVIDLTSLNLTGITSNQFQISIFNAPTFNYNGQYPLKVNGNTKVVIYNGSFKSIQPLSQFDYQHSISLLYSNVGGQLGNYTGTFKSFDVSYNSISGTIDPSWCSTVLVVQYNQLTGKIPSCFKCYFNDTSNDPIDSSIRSMKSRFAFNQFTNYDTNETCTTFKPIATYFDSTHIDITGQDIGFNFYSWYIDGLKCSATIYIFGKHYRCYVNDLTGKSYYSIRFQYPYNQTFTFPILNQLPQIKSVEIVSNSKYIISGSFFSTYDGYLNQSITLNGSPCNSDGTSEFFKISCNSPPILSKSILSITTVANSSDPNSTYTSKVLVSPSPLLNNIQCPNNCSNIINGVCDLSSGICMCLTGTDLSSFTYCSGHTITSIDPSGVDGGNTTLYGSFTENHLDLSITIGDKPCNPIYTVTDSTIVCTAPPGTGIKTIIMIQNDLTFIGTNMYKYIETTLQCPNDCTDSNHGKCNTTSGLCQCINNYQSYDCSIKISNSTSSNTPGDTTIDTGSGSTNVTSGETRFQIYFHQLNEIDIQGNTIKSYKLRDNWVYNSSLSASGNIYSFSQKLNNSNCLITSTIEEIQDTNGKQYTFANTTFKLDKGSIKFTISIKEYQYQSSLNSLVLDFVSSVDQLNNGNDQPCNSQNTELDTTNVINLQLFNFIKISKNNQILQGRFINRLESDGRSTFFTTTAKNESNSIILSLNLPHCTNECIIDPDFSYLVTPDFNTCDSDDKRKWVIPVAVVVSVVGASILIVIIIMLVKKNTSIKIFLNNKGSKLKKLNK